MDELLTIPMTGHVQSLNASVAAGLLMYQAFPNVRGVDHEKTAVDCRRLQHDWFVAGTCPA